MTATLIPMTPQYHGETLTTETAIRTFSRYVGREVRLGIGSVPRGQAARQTQGGPPVEGPWAFTYPLATVIARVPQRQQPTITAQVGDRFLIDGAEYVLTDDDRWRYPALTPVG